MPSTDSTEKPSIGAIIRTALSASDTRDAAELVGMVVDQISPADYRFYLESLIASRLSSEVNYLRDQVQPRVSARSTKRDLLRSEWWPQWLSQRIVTADGSYKFLREATADDLRFAAQTRRSQAAELLSNAEQFEFLAAAMDRARAVTLGDLSSADAAPVLGRAA